jgi:hypothetical protein
MSGFNQSVAIVQRARSYLADVRAGHISFADESAPFMTLTGYLADLLDVMEGTGDTRAYRAAARATLAELSVLGQLRREGQAGERPELWIERLQGSLCQLLGSTASQLATLDDADRDTLRQAITDAIGMRAAAAAVPCPICEAHRALLCPGHAAELDWVSVYRRLGQDLGLELEPS